MPDLQRCLLQDSYRTVEHDHELRRRDDGQGQAQPPRGGA
jgi:hypothetical protein